MGCSRTLPGCKDKALTLEQESIDITTRFDGQRFITSMRQGKRATSRRSAQLAAVRLGYKLFGDRFDHAQPWLELDFQPAGRQQWTLQAVPSRRGRSSGDGQTGGTP